MTYSWPGVAICSTFSSPTGWGSSSGGSGTPDIQSDKPYPINNNHIVLYAEGVKPTYDVSHLGYNRIWVYLYSPEAINYHSDNVHYKCIKKSLKLLPENEVFVVNNNDDDNDDIVDFADGYNRDGVIGTIEDNTTSGESFTALEMEFHNFTITSDSMIKFSYNG